MEYAKKSKETERIATWIEEFLENKRQRKEAHELWLRTEGLMYRRDYSSSSESDEDNCSGSSSATRAEVIASSVSAQHQPDIEGSPVSTASVPESRKGASPPESASEGAMLAIDWTREKRDERQCCLPVWSIPPYSPAQPSPKEAAGSNCTMGMSR